MALGRRSSVGLAALAYLAILITSFPAHGRGSLFPLADALQGWETSIHTKRLAESYRKENYPELLSGLDDLATSFPGAFALGGFDYLRAQALGRSGQHGRAIELLVDVANRYPVVGKYALSDAILWCQKAALWERAAEIANTLAGKYQPDAVLKETISGLASALVDAGRFGDALPYFENLDELYGTKTNRQFAFEIASCLERLGRTEEACERYFTFVMNKRRDDFSGSSLTRLEALGERGCSDARLSDGAFYLAAGEIRLWNHDHKQALSYFRKVLAKKKPAKLMRQAKKQIALCLFKQRNYKMAIEHLQELRKLYRSGDELAWIDLYLGHCHSRLKESAKAIERYRAASLGANGTGNGTAAKASYLLGRELEAARMNQQAIAAFQALLEEFPNSSNASHARWRMVLASFARGDKTAAEDLLLALVKLGTKTRYYDDACFALAMLYESLGRHDDAAVRYADNYAEFPNIYFGLASLDRLRELKSKGLVKPTIARDALQRAEVYHSEGKISKYLMALQKARVLAPDGSETSEKAAKLRESMLRSGPRTSALFDGMSSDLASFVTPSSKEGGNSQDAARFFMLLGLDDRAASILRSLSLRRPRDFELLYTLIKTFEKLGRKGEPLLLSERAFKRFSDLRLTVLDLPDWLAEALYPKGFSIQVERQSKLHNVEPAIVYAIIREESRFAVESTSSAAARGVMQLIVPTARQVAESLGMGELPLDQLYEPHINIALGVKYLRQLLDRFDDRTILALASYNGGPTNVDRWLADCPDDVADEEFINAITFSETRRYAQKVLASYRFYKQIYE
ncbi:transglycosylase SLT domain-containing protein [bacterium]|nr:transglycosylase SLT domain-containing protein [bacterium]